MVVMDATDIVYISAEAIVGLLTIIGNCLVLTAIIKTRRLHTITNVFVGNLAIADIAVGVLVAPCAALSFMGLPENFYGCIFINCLILMFTNISILMLLSVAIERFLAIKEPFLYHRILTVRRAILVNLCVWIFGSILGLMPMYGWHGGFNDSKYCRFTDVISYEYMVYFQFFGLILLPLFIMLCIYIYILIIVRRHLRQTNALHNRFQQNSTNDGFSKDVRAAKMFALVILLFGILWFPVNIFNIVSLFCGPGCTFPRQVLLVSIVMSHANSSINPFLYATSNSRIKGAIKALFGIKLKPDERSSTDHNHIRHATHGTPRARENTVAPIVHADNSSNSKGDIRSNAASHEDFHQSIAQIQLSNTEQTQGETDIILHNIKHSMNNNDIRETLNINSLSQNHSPYASYTSLPSLPNTNILSEVNTTVSQHPQKRGQHSFETSDNSGKEFIQLSIIPPPSNTSYNHVHCIHTNIHDGFHEQSNLAFIKSELLNHTDVVSIRHSNNERNNDISRDTTNGVIYENQTEEDNKELKSADNKYDNLWCWQLTGSQNNREIHKDIQEPELMYRHISIKPYHSSPVSEIKTVDGSIDSTEISVPNRYKGSTTETNHTTVFSDKLGFSESVQEDQIRNYTENKDVNRGINAKSTTSFKSYILADEYGILRNAKEEHTQL